MRPRIDLLGPELTDLIIAEAVGLLGSVGVAIEDEQTLELLASHGAVSHRSRSNGAGTDPGPCRVRLGEELIQRTLATAPPGFQLFDLAGVPAYAVDGSTTSFVPASAATRLLDQNEARPPRTADLIACARLVEQLPGLAAQSTAMVPADVPELVSDSWRLYLSLLHCTKPVVTGAFSLEGLGVIEALLEAARGDAEALRSHPLAVLTCCPTSPLGWSRTSSRTLIRCARRGIPVEIVAMPLAGFIAPVTLTGTLVQQTAETLAGLVIHQLAAPGAPLLWGTAAAIFDIRYETAPIGAVETMMMACGSARIGQKLGLPTQAYIALSDAKLLDAQAGLETSMGATLAVLAGIDSVSGPGMLDLINCFSLEKLVLDHEICCMAGRIGRGLEPTDDQPVQPLIEELLEQRHLLIADHTLRNIATEINLPGSTIDRASRERWLADGAQTLGHRAHAEAQRLLQHAPPLAVPWAEALSDRRRELDRIMLEAARAAGAEHLPETGTGAAACSP